jgi:hypothetical protein
MRVCLMAVLLSVAAAAAVAQEVSPESPPAFSPAAAAQQQPPPPPPPPPPVSRRRASMVSSMVRLRVDSARENRNPDRAEFFYAKCGCFGDDAPGPLEGAADDLDFQQLNIWAEYAFGSRFSVFGHLPFRWIQPQSFIPGTGPGFLDESGVSDFRAGAKLALAATETQSVTAQAQVFFPTGDAARGLGTDHAAVEPVLLYYARPADAVTVESQFGVWLPIGGSSAAPRDPEGDFAGRILTYGIGSGIEVYRGEQVRLGPVVELVGWRVLSGWESIPGAPADVTEASGINIVNAKVGARVTVADRHSVYVGYGRALTDETWYEDIFRIEYRVSLPD